MCGRGPYRMPLVTHATTISLTFFVRFTGLNSLSSILFCFSIFKDFLHTRFSERRRGIFSSMSRIMPGMYCEQSPHHCNCGCTRAHVQQDAVVGEEVVHAVEVAVGASVAAAFPLSVAAICNPSHNANLGYATLKTDEGLGA